MSRTAPPAALDSPAYWRRLLARTHPDAGGDDALFVWASALREVFLERQGEASEPLSGQQKPDAAREAPDRIPFDAGVEFEERTAGLLRFGRDFPEPYRGVLTLLVDCHGVNHGRSYAQQYKGASYRALAAIAHVAGMSKPERCRWYGIAEELGISSRHAAHILGKLKRGER